ncbi:MAG: gliding motility-associated protein GldE [Chlorobi bacterium]|nr:gliding motility-associated protein GldE [Chlorobiota bacterium]
MGTAVSIVVCVLLLALSASISGAEIAYFSLTPKDLEEIKKHESKTNKLILKHLKHPELLLATILIGNNFVNVGIVMLTTFIVSSLVTFGSSTTLQFIIEVVGITGLILLFGEIIPKVYASYFSKKFASIMAYPLMIMISLFKPLGVILVKSTNLVNKRLAKKQRALSMDELSHAVELTSSDIEEEKELLEGIVKFSNIKAEEIMTPRVDVVDLDIKWDFKKVLHIIVESGFSRLPVYEDTPDNIKGILYVKDLLLHIDKDASFRWQTLMREAYYIPETKMINDLLREFQEHKIHMAIVVDEYGGTSGIVTLEDVIEEIVGEISDEMDVDEDSYRKLPDGTYIFEGKTLLNDFFKITDIDETVFDDVRGDAETLAGLLLEIKGAMPAKNEEITFDNFKFTILAADNRRIKKLSFKRIEEDNDNADNQEKHKQ